MPSFETDFEVVCNECDGTIKAAASFRRNALIVKIDPCPRCLETATNTGYKQGDGDGYDRGYDMGYDMGLAAGKASTGKET